MLEVLRNKFLIFMFYSILGWIVEVIYAYLTKKRFSNRGFFIGPYCPVYGVGCIFMIALLSKFKSYPVLVFILAIIICSVLEYFTSYMMEKLFKARWWDYTKTKFNINGRVCADTMLLFGIIACLVIYLLHPAVINVIEAIPEKILTIISIAILIIFLTDIIISLNVVIHFTKTIKAVSLEDRTDDINNYVKDLLSKKSLLHKRLIKAFPTSYTIVKKKKKKD